MRFDSEFWEFVDRHAGDDVTRLRLKYYRDPRPWMPAAIAHIEALPKARQKFGRQAASAGGWPMLLPSVLAVEQATPPAVAAYNASFVPRAARVVDMTAGLGSDSFHIASRAAQLHCFDLNESNARALEINFAGRQNVTVHCGDSVKWLGEYSGPCLDVVFIDPARRGAGGARVYNLHDCQPDLIEIYQLIKSKARRLVAKLSPMLDITQTFRDLPDCGEIHVNEDGGEVRQLLAVADFSGSGIISAQNRRVVVAGDGWSYSFSLAEASAAEPCEAMPQAGHWLVEPSPAMMKAGAFNLVARRYGVGVVAANSHLFVSAEKPSADMPGRKSRIIEIYPLKSSALKKLGKTIGPAEIVVRNLPGFTAQSLRARLGIADGSQRRVVATTLADGSRALILVDKAAQHDDAGHC